MIFFSKLGRCGRVNFHHSPGDLLVAFSNSSSLPGRKSGTSMARSAGDVLIVLGVGPRVEISSWIPNYIMGSYEFIVQMMRQT